MQKMIKTYYLDVLTKHYADFSGCVGRKAYWLFVLWNAITFILLEIICNYLGNAGNVIYALASLAVFIPSLGMAVRRLHDSDKSAWWLLLYLIPVFGWIVIFVFLVLPSTENRYHS